MSNKRILQTVVRTTLILSFFLLALGAASATVAAQMPPAPAAPFACQDGDQPSGAKYSICLPATWNGDLVVYAHGYVDPTKPVEVPKDPVTLALADFFTANKYAFAASSYRRNGLAILEGIDDLVELVNLFTAQHGRPDRVILVGLSEGGAITVMAVERHPEVFHGGLALCGPYGDFQWQVDYFAGFRTVFDYYFPGLMPPTAIDIPENLLNTWETNYYSETVRPVITDPANAISVTQVLSVTGAAFDPNVPATTEQTFERLFWYNIYSTNDGRQQLGGNPFGNQGVQYTGSLDDVALNAGVARFTADITATATISSDYQTTGRLTRPLITMHTTGDPVVPYWHAKLYAQKVAAAGSDAFYENRPVTAYGHCKFNTISLALAFNDLAARANQRALYLPIVAK